MGFTFSFTHKNPPFRFLFHRNSHPSLLPFPFHRKTLTLIIVIVFFGRCRTNRHRQWVRESKHNSCPRKWNIEVSSVSPTPRQYWRLASTSNHASSSRANVNQHVCNVWVIFITIMSIWSFWCRDSFNFFQQNFKILSLSFSYWSFLVISVLFSFF